MSFATAGAAKINGALTIAALINSPARPMRRENLWFGFYRLIIGGFHSSFIASNRTVPDILFDTH